MSLLRVIIHFLWELKVGSERCIASLRVSGLRAQIRTPFVSCPPCALLFLTPPQSVAGFLGKDPWGGKYTVSAAKSRVSWSGAEIIHPHSERKQRCLSSPAARQTNVIPVSASQRLCLFSPGLSSPSFSSCFQVPRAPFMAFSLGVFLVICFYITLASGFPVDLSQLHSHV